MSTIVSYKPNTKRRLSNFWTVLREKDLDPSIGLLWMDDFMGLSGPALVANTVTAWGPYEVRIDTSNTVKIIANEAERYVELATDATDNDAVEIGFGETADQAQLGTKVAIGNIKCFEALVNLSDVTTAQGAFVGMAAPGTVAAGGDAFLADSATELATIDAIGFRIVEGDPDGWDAVYGKAGAAVTIVKEVAHAAIVDTWVALGWLFDAVNNKILYYANGILVASASLTATAPTNWPNGNGLSVAACIKNGTTTARKMRLMQWACGMYTGL